jgi:drug/metabolite transporter (DMT)-like permease
LIGKIGSVKTSMVSILVPVFGIIWSAIFLNEKINVHMLLGLSLVITSVYFVLTNKTLFHILSISFSIKKKACIAC